MIKNIKYLLLPFLLVFFVLPNITSAQTASSPECQSEVSPLPWYCNNTTTTNISNTTGVPTGACLYDADAYAKRNLYLTIKASDNKSWLDANNAVSVNGKLYLLNKPGAGWSPWYISTGKNAPLFISCVNGVIKEDGVSSNSQTTTPPKVTTSTTNNTLTPAPTTLSQSSSCLSLNHNLMIGISKDTDTEGEVSSLQSFLQSIGTFNNSPTGYFGKYTKQAVKDFQAKSYDNISADDIDSTLVPSLANRQWLAQNGFSINKTGYVGSFTRAKIKYISCHKLSDTNQVTNTTTSNFQSGGGDLCAQYGITQNTEVVRVGNTNKDFPIKTTQAYSISLTTGAIGETAILRNDYSSVMQYGTLSKNKCDFSATLEPLCAKQSFTPVIYYKVGGTSTFQCILEPNTTYYFNVRDATRDPTTKVFTNTCPVGSTCSFRGY